MVVGEEFDMVPSAGQLKCQLLGVSPCEVA